jgi:acetylornithine deacetylase/succinyl-diaminopimelate desuccinylase-like protein
MTRMQTIARAKATEPDLQKLWDILQLRRPGGSKTERRFVARYLDSIGCQSDSYGNRWLRIGDSPVLWSSHTDTVHTTPGKQRIKVTDGIIALADTEKESNCLGGDCGVGVWIMLELIRARKPGLYVFHRDEETGGHGSAWIAENNPGLLAGIKYAIALDRKGTNSIITYQSGARCASDAFAESLADQLHGYAPDSTGLFTDTHNYTRLVPECTNLSVGYEAAHTSKETVNVYHASALVESLLALDVTRLVCARDPATVESLYNEPFDDWQWEGPYGRFDSPAASYDRRGRFVKRADSYEARSVLDFVESYPDVVADILEQYGITLDDLYDSAPWIS